jgi:hypothetical protein
MKAESLHLSLSSKEVRTWIRVSTEDQVRGESPEHHERCARYYAESKDSSVSALNGCVTMPSIISLR